MSIFTRNLFHFLVISQFSSSLILHRFFTHHQLSYIFFISKIMSFSTVTWAFSSFKLLVYLLYLKWEAFELNTSLIEELTWISSHFCPTSHKGVMGRLILASPPKGVFSVGFRCFTPSACPPQLGSILFGASFPNGGLLATGEGGATWGHLCSSFLNLGFTTLPFHFFEINNVHYWNRFLIALAIVSPLPTSTIEVW